jgi:hypothetical protein
MLGYDCRCQGLYYFGSLSFIRRLLLWRVDLLLLLNVLVPYFQNGWWKFRCRNIMHFLMMDQNLWWEAFKYPDMFQCFIWCHSFPWV